MGLPFKWAIQTVKQISKMYPLLGAYKCSVEEIKQTKGICGIGVEGVKILDCISRNGFPGKVT